MTDTTKKIQPVDATTEERAAILTNLLQQARTKAYLFTVQAAAGRVAAAGTELEGARSDLNTEADNFDEQAAQLRTTAALYAKMLNDLGF